MAYLVPANVTISDDFQGHRNRGSAEPGTDYATSYGTDLVVPWDGTVSVVDRDPSGAEGRRLSIDLDDGRRVSWIHLSVIWVEVGARVGRGWQGVALSGASGFGSDRYYGPHVHVSLWERPGMPYDQTIDFERYVGDEPTPEPEREDLIMAHAVIYTKDSSDQDRRGAVIDLESGFVSEFGWFPISYADNLAQGFGHDQAAPLTAGQYDVMLRDAKALSTRATTNSPPTRSTSREPKGTHPLTTPAWIGVPILGVLGVVEVIRLVVEHLVP